MVRDKQETEKPHPTNQNQSDQPATWNTSATGLPQQYQGAASLQPPSTPQTSIEGAREAGVC